MKKYLLIILSLFIFLPSLVNAEDIIYDKFDIKVPYTVDTKVKDITYKIYVSTIEDSENLKESSSSFKVSDFKYYKLNETNEKEYLDKTYTLTEDESYGFEMIIESNLENAVLENIYENQIMINGTDLEKYTTHTFENKDKTIVLDVLLYEKQEEIEEETIEEEPDITIVHEEKEETKDCILGLEFCCKEYYGISLCLWVCMGVALLLIIITAIRTIVDKNDDKKYKDFN